MRRSRSMDPRRRDEIAVGRERRAREGGAIGTAQITQPVAQRHRRMTETFSSESPPAAADILNRALGEMIRAVAFGLFAFRRRQRTRGRLERLPDSARHLCVLALRSG